ncbi:MAG: hypothetical protein P1T08_08065 [Acidimicrobiia bacterium]|nr:hypothetical protein [Acidimicrobiia bacterium]
MRAWNQAPEPHYDTVADPGQVQIYETILLTTDREVTTTLLRGATYLKDNRLLPAPRTRRQSAVRAPAVLLDLSNEPS